MKPATPRSWSARAADRVVDALGSGAVLTSLVVALEPVWAIGTSKTPHRRNRLRNAQVFIRCILSAAVWR